MSSTFVFFYLMSNDVAKIREAAPAHVAYWKDAALPNYTGGPFADRSGGLITFGADGAEDAARVVAEDPFVRRHLVDGYWVKEWIPE